MSRESREGETRRKKEFSTPYHNKDKERKKRKTYDHHQYELQKVYKSNLDLLLLVVEIPIHQRKSERNVSKVLRYRPFRFALQRTALHPSHSYSPHHTAFVNPLAKPNRSQLSPTLSPPCRVQPISLSSTISSLSTPHPDPRELLLPF